MMIPAPLLPNEAERLVELREYDILDSMPEGAYDAITFLASQICDVPIALISIIDEDRQWFKSRVGIDVAETPRDLAFCAHAIHQPRSLMVVQDASKDVRFEASPLVTTDPAIKFYAGAPLVSPHGNALGTLCVIDRKPRHLTGDQEKALQALSVQVMALLEMRRMVRELERQQEALEEATRQRDALMATVSHEIRTPLTAVVGYVELLRSELPDDVRAEMLETVGRQAAEVEYLLGDLLVAARAEADSLRVAAVPVNLSAQVAQVVEGLDPTAGADIVVETGMLCRATGDPARVRQIIRNLISNAMRYGGPHVAVRSDAVDGWCRLSVVDDGEGISVQDQDRIFEPFQQAQDAPYVAASVGLGLPISRLLAEKMGGTLTYRYDEGHSVFELSLPPVAG